MSKHTLSVLVENKPGVLTRVAGLFARRGFNIDTLSVGPTDEDQLSRITLTVDDPKGQVRAAQLLDTIQELRDAGAEPEPRQPGGLPLEQQVGELVR